MKKTGVILLLSALLLLHVNLDCLAAVDPGFANGETATIGTGLGMYPWPSLAEGFGGSDGSEISNTNITIDSTANLITNLYGGSKAGAVRGGTNLMYNGDSNVDFKTATSGYGIFHLYGGNSAGIVGGGTHLTVNSGWVRGWVIGGGLGTVGGDAVVNINGGLVGACIDDYSSGMGEVYGGPTGVGSVLYGDTHVNISGAQYDPDSYRPGDNPTIVRQHVLGGGQSGGLVVGNTHVNLTGGTVLGHVTGGGGGGGLPNKVIGDAHVTVSGGEIGQLTPDLNGGSVFGGGYAGGNDVIGNTYVTISNDAHILGDVYGGGKSRPGQSNTVSGNSRIDILGGIIDGDIYGGGQNDAVLAGHANINLRHIIAGNPFIESFRGAILPGNAKQDANLYFMNYHGPFHGSIGRLEDASKLSEVKIFDYSKVIFPDGKPINAKIMKIEDNASASFFADTTISADSFVHLGNIELNNYGRPDYVTLTIDGDYVSAGGTLDMSAKNNAEKDFLLINGDADLTSGRSTIYLTLDEGWDGSRIDLVDIKGLGDVESFDLNVKDFDGGEVVLKKEVLPEGTVEWYVEYQALPTPQPYPDTFAMLALLSIAVGLASLGLLLCALSRLHRLFCALRCMPLFRMRGECCEQACDSDDQECDE